MWNGCLAESDSNAKYGLLEEADIYNCLKIYCLILKTSGSVVIGLFKLGKYNSIILMAAWKWTHLTVRGRRGWYNLAMYWQQYHFYLHDNPAKEMAKGEASTVCAPLEGINQCSWQNSLSANVGTAFHCVPQITVYPLAPRAPHSLLMVLQTLLGWIRVLLWMSGRALWTHSLHHMRY